MHVRLRHKQNVHEAEVRHEGGIYRITTANGDVHEVAWSVLADGTARLEHKGRSYRVAIARDGRERLISIAGEVHTFTPEAAAHAGHAVGQVATPEIVAPMPGKILQVLVQAGDTVQAGDGLIILEAMKMETRLGADAAATVAEVRVEAGDTVDGGQVLVVLAYT